MAQNAPLKRGKGSERRKQNAHKLQVQTDLSMADIDELIDQWGKLDGRVQMLEEARVHQLPIPNSYLQSTRPENALADSFLEMLSSGYFSELRSLVEMR